MDLIPIDPYTLLRVEQGGQPVVVYKCQLQGCKLFVEGTTSAVSAHLRGHHFAGPDGLSTTCTWGTCTNTLKKGSMTRHILGHLGVKLSCSVCGVIKCRLDVLRAHIKGSDLCNFASADVVNGPGGRLLIPTSWSAASQVWLA